MSAEMLTFEANLTPRDVETINKALAAARRGAVERIRAGLDALHTPDGLLEREQIRVLLRKEAALDR